MIEAPTVETSTELISRLRGVEAAPWMARIEQHAAWPVLARLPILLTVRLSLKHFSVRDLLSLEEGQVFGSDSSQTMDVPLAVGQVKLAWCEFEVSAQKIGVRLTQLA